MTPSAIRAAVEAKLEPCPFCGGAANVMPRTCDKTTPYNPRDRAFPTVHCMACFASVQGKDWGEPATAIAAWNRRAASPVAAQVDARAELPALLFDGYYVYEEGLTDRAKQRTSPDNVSDVLDAVVRLLRASTPNPIQGEGEKTEQPNVHRALPNRTARNGDDVRAVRELSVDEAVALVREKANAGYGYGPKGSRDEFDRCYSLSPLQLATTINAAFTALAAPNRTARNSAKDAVGVLASGEAQPKGGA